MSKLSEAKKLANLGYSDAKNKCDPSSLNPHYLSGYRRGFVEDWGKVMDADQIFSDGVKGMRAGQI
jgi:hypothetical protein